MSTTRRALAVSALLVGSLASGCTLAKPVVGAVTGPVVMLAAVGQGGGCGCTDGRAILVLMAVGSAVGAGVGLVTGIISDIQAITGAATEPTRNWWDPLKTNTSN